MSTHSLRRLLQTRINHVEHHKSTHGIGHEFLLITFEYQGQAEGKVYTRHIRIERSVSYSASLSSFTSSVLTLGIGRTATDLISISPSPFDTSSSYLLYSLEFSTCSRTLTIADLASVLIGVQDMAPKYKLYNHMCYWFSRAVFEGLSFVCHAHAVPRERAWLRGRFLYVFNVAGSASVFDSYDSPHCITCTRYRAPIPSSLSNKVFYFRQYLQVCLCDFYRQERPRA